jgi:hypothetical protein
VIEAGPANRGDVTSEIEIVIKHHSKVARRFRWFGIDSQQRDRESGQILSPLLFVTYEEKFRFIRVQF